MNLPLSQFGSLLPCCFPIRTKSLASPPRSNDRIDGVLPQAERSGRRVRVCLKLQRRMRLCRSISKRLEGAFPWPIDKCTSAQYPQSASSSTILLSRDNVAYTSKRLQVSSLGACRNRGASAAATCGARTHPQIGSFSFSLY